MGRLELPSRIRAISSSRTLHLSEFSRGEITPVLAGEMHRFQNYRRKVNAKPWGIRMVDHSTLRLAAPISAGAFALIVLIHSASAATHEQIVERCRNVRMRCGASW